MKKYTEHWAVSYIENDIHSSDVVGGIDADDDEDDEADDEDDDESINHCSCEHYVMTTFSLVEKLRFQPPGGHHVKKWNKYGGKDTLNVYFFELIG